MNSFIQRVREEIVNQIESGAYSIPFGEIDTKTFVFEDMPGLGVLIVYHYDSRNVYTWKDIEILSIAPLLRNTRH